jgi:hypothetical protein
MPEQTIDVVSGSGKIVNSNIGAPGGLPAAETSGVMILGSTQITWIEIKDAAGRKTLTERLNEVYRDDDLEPEEQEFLELTREHFSRLDDE